jgi:hypothetical protein
MYFNYIQTSKNNGSTKVVLEMDITLNNLWTAFIPIYYIIGLVPPSHHATSEFPTFETFDAIYSHFSPTCSFIPAFGNTFNEKHRFSMRLSKQRNVAENNEESRNTSLML